MDAAIASDLVGALRTGVSDLLPALCTCRRAPLLLRHGPGIHAGVACASVELGAGLARPHGGDRCAAQCSQTLRFRARAAARAAAAAAVLLRRRNAWI